MTFHRPRTGVFAIIAGRETEAVAAPVGDLLTLADGRVVPVADCDRVDEVVTVANHLGHECVVIAIDETGSAGLHYTGPDKTAAARAGFAQIDPGTWAKNVNVHELSRFRERHTDLLFPTWVR